MHRSRFTLAIVDVVPSLLSAVTVQCLLSIEYFCHPCFIFDYHSIFQIILIWLFVLLLLLQELKNLRPQLYSAAEYCEKSYLHSEQKQMYGRISLVMDSVMNRKCSDLVSHLQIFLILSQVWYGKCYGADEMLWYDRDPFKIYISVLLFTRLYTLSELQLLVPWINATTVGW